MKRGIVNKYTYLIALVNISIFLIGKLNKQIHKERHNVTLKV